jgi:hypothetical protein
MVVLGRQIFQGDWSPYEYEIQKIQYGAKQLQWSNKKIYIILCIVL